MLKRLGLIARNLAGSIVVAAALAPSPAAAQDAVALTWARAKIYVPASLTKDRRDCSGYVGRGDCLGKIAPGRHPVVVFLHGSLPTQTGRFWNGLGVIVVAPDSFARPGRVSGENAYREAKWPFVQMRIEEARFAAAQLAGQPWADPSRLILAGHSEGGITAALYPGSEYRARIIFSWTCRGWGGQWDGIRGSGPVLALHGDADPLFHRLGQGRGCVDHIGGRGPVVVIPGGRHHLWNMPLARQSVAAFLAQVAR